MSALRYTQYATFTVLLTFINALVVTKLDYCNSVLVGVTRTLQCRLQSVFNAAARLVFSAMQEIWTPPWPPLAKGNGPNPVSFMCCLYRCFYSIAPVIIWLKHSTWHLVSNHVVVSVLDQHRHVDHTTNYIWRSSISSGRCTGLECSVGVCQNFWIVHCVQATNKNAALYGIFQRWPNMIAPVVTVVVTADLWYVTLLFV